PEAMIPLAADGRLARVRQWTVRRFAELLAQRPALLDGLLARTRDKDEPVRRDVIAGMTAGLAGVRKAAAPTRWASYPRQFSGPDAALVSSAMQGLGVGVG